MEEYAGYASIAFDQQTAFERSERRRDRAMYEPQRLPRLASLAHWRRLQIGIFKIADANLALRAMRFRNHVAAADDRTAHKGACQRNRHRG